MRLINKRISELSLKTENTGLFDNRPRLNLKPDLVNRDYKYLVFSGNWEQAHDIFTLLYQKDYRITLTPAISDLELRATLPELLVVALKDDLPLPRIEQVTQQYNLTWMAWNRTNIPQITLAAYQAGALAVLPTYLTLSTLSLAIEDALAAINGGSDSLTSSTKIGSLSTYAHGQIIPLRPNAVLIVQEGIIEVNTVRIDGARVILGLYGPGQMLVGHPNDCCFIQVTAHTDVTVLIQQWEEAAREVDFPHHLNARIVQMEAWTAMQVRPHLEERLLGIFSLLCEQFGLPHSQGMLLDVRLTHEQLAGIIGCTRTSVTRVLGILRKRKVLSLIETEDGTRFCLHEWESGEHIGPV